jgi:hypothetical protein
MSAARIALGALAVPPVALGRAAPGQRCLAGWSPPGATRGSRGEG